MKATFLEAEVPLTKTFYKNGDKIEKIGHPRILDYTSHEREFTTLEELCGHLKRHAALGHCFLKGNVVRPLVKEPRAGTTDPNAPTQLLLLDIDGIKGGDSIAQILAQLKLDGADYVTQYSSSMGVLPGRGMSAHVFVLLDQEYAPAILKQYLMQWNLTIPLLQQNLGLTRTYNALRWSLDITTCQNDKLIYIADPICKDGVEDSFEGDRIAFVQGAKRRLSLGDPFPNAEANAEKAQAKLNELRKAMGLKERPKTTMKTRGSVEYMARPDRAVVTGIREKDTFTYLNLNGGDSWGYYHPTSNPEFIHNFKNEPVYKTSELLPEYWAEVKERMNQVRADADGKLYLAFRDFRTATYYNGIYDDKAGSLKIAIAKSEKQLKDFLQQHGQPYGEFVRDGSVVFNPHSDVTVDVDTMMVNMYQPSVYMRMKPRKVTEVPPTVLKVVQHALGNDKLAVEHFLNWLAVIMQHKCMTGTAWVLHGTTGTGKGLLLRAILRPLLGAANVSTKRIREIDSQFNGYMENSFLVWVDEAEQNDFNTKGAMNADIKNFITESPVSIRRMHTMPYEVPNYANWILSSNKGHIIQIDPEDRRFNVAAYQDQKLDITDGEIRQIEDELVDFHGYLMTREADKGIARTPLNNTAKRSMVLLNQPTIDVASDAIRSGRLEFFWDALPQNDITLLPRWDQEVAERYIGLVKSIVQDEPSCILREELQLLLEYTIGGLPKTPAKFSSMLKHHKLDIVPVTRGGKSFRGVPVKWKVKPEWKEKP
jgi:hypothetical protein